jgi:hypothetical protein
MRSLVLLATLLAAACDASRRTPLSDEPWTPGPPQSVRLTGQFADPRLTESSGVAVSRAHPGILWTQNDAGHPAVLFATDTLGTALGYWQVTGARSVDWEEIAIGPCPGGECIYIGDLGDNQEIRPQVMIYRFAEPDPASGGGVVARVDTLRIHYPDRPRDVEAMFAAPDGTLWLISKGRSTGILAYRVPAASWEQGSAVAEIADTLPILHHLASGRLVTGAAIARDGKRVVIRTYRDLFFFLLDDNRLVPAPPPNRCEILGLEPQGEAVDWWDDSTLVLTSEGRRGPIHLLQCGRVGG